MKLISLGRRSAVALLPAVLLAGCSKSAPPPPPPEKPKVEQDLSRTTISAKAAKSLRIRSEKLHAQPVQEQAQLTGWIMAKQGNEVTLTAEVAGFVREPADPEDAPVPGRRVRRNQELLLVEPVLSPLDQIQLAALKRSAESDVVKARESLVVAEKEWERVEGLFKQKLRAEQDLEQARARLKHAKEDLAAAEHRLKLYNGGGNRSGPISDPKEGQEAQLKPRPVMAPRAGTVLAVHVSPGQYVPLAAPLATVADLSELWVRVPVPEVDLARVDRGQSATVVPRPSGIGLNPQQEKRPNPSFSVKPVAIVPQVDPTRHTADLVYELPPLAAERGIFAKDQMVTVLVPLTGGRREKEYVVPYAAVIFDAHGGAWIYFDLTPEGSREHIYERRRVEMGPNVELPAGAYEGRRDGIVVGLVEPPGSLVVTDAAAALFSREFHKPPVPTGAPGAKVDDDD